MRTTTALTFHALTICAAVALLASCGALRRAQDDTQPRILALA